MAEAHTLRVDALYAEFIALTRKDGTLLFVIKIHLRHFGGAGLYSGCVYREMHMVPHCTQLFWLQTALYHTRAYNYN